MIRIDIGVMSIVTPTGPKNPGLRLNRKLWAQLELAVMAEEEGDQSFAGDLLRDIEDRLGITEHDRLSATGGEIVGQFVTLDIAKAKPDRVKEARADRRRVIALIPEADAPVTKQNVVDLDDAEAARAHGASIEARALKAFHEGDRQTARRLHGEASSHLGRAKQLAEKAETDRNGRTTIRERERGLAEVRSIAKAHGEQIVEETGTAFVTVQAGIIPVERQQVTKRIRNTSRDGLESMRTQAKIKRGEGIHQVQFAAGMRYREFFEGAQADLGSGMDDGGGGSSSGSRCPTSDRRLWVRDQLVKLERRVEHEAGPTGLHVLREVAGKGRCLSHLSTSGSRQDYLKGVLKQALDVVARALSIH